VRLVVTGREGQVARSLIERSRGRADVEVVTVGRPALFLEDPATVLPALQAAAPDMVVSAAAYTAVDKAEDEPDLAFAINAAGAGHVAAAAAVLGVPVIHLSTDYVLGGPKKGPHDETGATLPCGVYAASKLAGEEAMARANPRHVILRTAWVYSPFGKNFVRTMLKLANERDTLTVVSDQWGSPTSALDIADAILIAATAMHEGCGRDVHGLYHFAGTGETNWSGFARHILATSRKYGGPYAEVSDITTADCPTKANRPHDSRLSSAWFAGAFGWTAPHWRESSEVVVARLLNSEPLL